MTRQQKENELAQMHESFQLEKNQWADERKELLEQHKECNTKINEEKKKFNEYAQVHKIKIAKLEKDLEDISIQKEECEKSIQLFTEKLEAKDLLIKELQTSSEQSVKKSLEHEKIQFRVKMEKQNNTNRRLQEQNEKLKSENRELLLDNKNRQDVNNDLKNDYNRQTQNEEKKKMMMEQKQQKEESTA
jgi:hypothetical protein